MFDSWIEQLYAPKIQCNKCHKQIALTGDYVPTEIICLNCGNKINPIFSDNYNFPNTKFNEDGTWVEEKEVKEENDNNDIV